MVHHHRHGEMKHHKEREAHKSAHRAKKAEEHSLNQAMIEKHHGVPSKAMTAKESIVRDSHQEGIARVMQKPGDMEVGQHGKMLVHEWHKDPKGHNFPNSK